MASYLNFFTTTSSRGVAYIRQNLLANDNDGDTEDDTHLCRVLRAYYTEKGRPFPGWLPPDPKAPPPPVVQPIYSQSNVGSRYGGLQIQQGGGSGPLSSLWDSQPPQPPEQQSLRQGRGAPPNALSSGGRSQRQNPFTRQQQSDQRQEVVPRGLPSQNAGSQQSTMFGRDAQTPPRSSAGMTAKEKLKFGQRPGRVASPANGMADSIQSSNSYGSSTSGGYDDRPRASDNGYGGSRGGDRPFVAATAPWASNEAEFSGGGYGGGDGGGGGGMSRQGLPSGPAAGRRGPGLPSGPRGMR